MDDSQAKELPLLLTLVLSGMLAGCIGGSGGSGTDGRGFTLSGSIAASAGSEVDGSLPNPDSPARPNNSFEQAQSLSNPVILGGHAATSTDPSDFYAVSLAEGQGARLEISNFSTTAPGAVDLDLYLYDAGQLLVASSISSNQPSEQVTAPADGDYVLEVRAASGASNYVLTVGHAASASSLQQSGTGEDGSLGMAVAPDQDFLPGEMIVRFRDAPGEAQETSRIQHLEEKSRITGMRAKGGGPGRAMLMGVYDDTERDAAFGILGIDPDALGLSHNLQSMPEQTRQKLDTLQMIKALRQRDDVLYAEPNYIRHTLLAPDDALFPSQWHYNQINLGQAWDLNTGSADVVVAVVDSGVLLAHPDLAGKFTGTGHDFISDPVRAMHGNGINPNANDPGDGIVPGTSSFHGTHVAGTVAAATNNAIGVAGVGWQTRILPVRVTGRGGLGSSYDIIQGVRYAAGLSNDSGGIPTPRADIINLSLGGTSSSTFERDTYNAVLAQGIIVIAAAGNSNSTTPLFPAAYPGVISVGAADANRNKAYYSNSGPTLDLMAPGGDMRFSTNGNGLPDGIISTHASDSSGIPVPGYGIRHGTSMAAPHVSGVAALMKAAHPGLTPEQFRTLLEAGDLTQPRPDTAVTGTRNDLHGYGLLDAQKALEAAILAAGTPAASGLQITPGNLVFGPFLLGSGANNEQQSFVLGATGPAGLSIDSVQASQPWLTVTGTEINANGFGTYTVSVDHTNRPVGIYSGVITITSGNVPDINVNVSFQVRDPSEGFAGDAGVHYVTLLNAKTFELVDQLMVDVTEGVYPYAFRGVAPGEYFVVAGTDNNNDGSICDPGEACGTYSSFSQPTAITIGNGNRTGIDFISGYQNGMELGTLQEHLPNLIPRQPRGGNNSPDAGPSGAN